MGTGRGNGLGDCFLFLKADRGRLVVCVIR